MADAMECTLNRKVYCEMAQWFKCENFLWFENHLVGDAFHNLILNTT